MIFVDTSVWINYFNGKNNRETLLLDHLLGSEPVCIGDLVYAEILQGFRSDRDFETARKLLDTLFFQNMLGKDIALQSAINYRKLKKLGVTVRKTIDVFIGTFCIEHGHALLHSDKDFEPMKRHLGLVVL